MHAGDSSLVCSRDRCGELVARIGVPLADAYLEFLGGYVRDDVLRSRAGRNRQFCGGISSCPPVPICRAGQPRVIRARRVVALLVTLVPAARDQTPAEPPPGAALT